MSTGWEGRAYTLHITRPDDTTGLRRLAEVPARAPSRTQDLMPAAGRGVQSRMTVGPKCPPKCGQYSRVWWWWHRFQICFQPVQEIEAPLVVAPLTLSLCHRRVGVQAVIEPHSVGEI